MEKLREWTTFWKEFRQTFHTTGAVLPSSRYLARAITAGCASAPPNARILEAGPGTGAFTGRLVSALRPGDHLVLVELNDRFVDVLRRRFDMDPAWRSKRDQVEILHQSIEALDVASRFHVIVCGLPFNNFDPEFVDRLFGQFLDHLEMGGSFSFFEYLAIRKLKAPFVSSAERARLDRIARVIDGHLASARREDQTVFRNVPPAIVHRLIKIAD